MLGISRKVFLQLIGIWHSREGKALSLGSTTSRLGSGRNRIENCTHAQLVCIRPWELIRIALDVN